MCTRLLFCFGFVVFLACFSFACVLRVLYVTCGCVTVLFCFFKVAGCLMPTRTIGDLDCKRALGAIVSPHPELTLAAIYAPPDGMCFFSVFCCRVFFGFSFFFWASTPHLMVRVLVSHYFSFFSGVYRVVTWRSGGEGNRDD